MKENEIQRQKLEWSQMMASVERERQEMSDFRVQIDTLKETNNTLHRDTRAFQDVISEQKVCLRRVDFIYDLTVFRPQTLMIPDFKLYLGDKVCYLHCISKTRQL